jgi:hypothetical protein
MRITKKAAITDAIKRILFSAKFPCAKIFLITQECDEFENEDDEIDCKLADGTIVFEFKFEAAALLIALVRKSFCILVPFVK